MSRKEVPLFNYIELIVLSLNIVGIYSEDVKEAVMVLSELNNGVTHIMFSSDGQTLYTGFRMV